MKKGDENSKFFHGIMSSRRRSNYIFSLMADGDQIEGVETVRQMVFHHFQNHFKRIMQARPNIGSLLFKSLSVTEGVDLIKPFLLEEIKAAILDCDSFRCPGPDGINLRFFKDFWEVLKIDLLIFFRKILS